VYPSPPIISGATYPGVPHYVFMTSPWLIILASPKSEILIIEPGSLLAYSKFSG